MNIEIVEKDSIYLVGLRCETLLKDTREKLIIPKLQQAFNQRIDEINGLVNGPVTYGVFIDPPNYKPDTDLFTWIAAAEVREEYTKPDDMIYYQLPARKYAVIDYKGNIDDAGSAYDTLYRWIQGTEYKIADLFGFEMYSYIHSAFERKQSDFKLHFPITLK